MSEDITTEEKLKRDWLSDSSWDIEDTEGFEDHREELLAWRQEHERKRAAERESHEAVIKALRTDPRWLRAALAAIEGGRHQKEAIRLADEFVALVQEPWIP